MDIVFFYIVYKYMGKLIGIYFDILLVSIAIKDSLLLDYYFSRNKIYVKQNLLWRVHFKILDRFNF